MLPNTPQFNEGKALACGHLRIGVRRRALRYQSSAPQPSPCREAWPTNLVKYGGDVVGLTNKKAAPGRVSVDAVPRGSRSMLTSFPLSDAYHIPIPMLGGSGSGSGSGVGSGSGRGCGIFPRAGVMILSSLCGTNISAARGVCRRDAAGTSASGTRAGDGALAGSITGGAGRGSGRGAKCGGAASGCGLCICGKDAPAPDACRDSAEAAADDFTVAAGAAGAFDGTFIIVAAFTIDCADCAFATGFAAGAGLATAALDGDDAPAEDGHIATMALFALVITWPSRDMRPGFCAGAFATTLAAGGFGVVLATGCAFATGFAEGWAFA